MRNFLTAAIFLMAGNVADAQYFQGVLPGGEPIVIDIPRVEIPPVYVRVPGFVEIGRRPVAPPPAYYGPAPQRYYGPPRAVTIDDDDELMVYQAQRRYDPAPRYAPPSRIRQPKQVTYPTKKPAPKVAAVREPVTTRQQRTRSAIIPPPPQAPSAAATVAPAPLAAPTPSPELRASHPVITEAPNPAATSVGAVAPERLEAASVPGVVAVPVTPPPPQTLLSVAPSPSPDTALPAPALQVAPAPAAANAAATESAAVPRVAVTPSAASPATSVHAAQPPVTTKNSKTVFAALPLAKQESEVPIKSATAPIGMWSSNEGQLRVQRCGNNLCGYAVGGTHAGQMVLIHMRQTRENSWSGQVKDVRSGQNYSGTISMRGANSLNITGCAMGGMFCGSQAMSRVQ